MNIPAFRPSSFQLLLALLLIGGTSAPSTASAQGDTPASKNSAEGDDIGFSAASVEYDSNTEVVTAKGDVVVNRDGYTLRADTIIWNRKTGDVSAEGNIRSIGPDGDVAYGDKISVTDSLKDGVVDNLLVVLADESRLAAKKGARNDGVYSLDFAAYTACKVQRPDGCPKEPSWEVKAVKVVYDPAKKRVKYEGARIELFGLPILPLPLLSHPVDTKAGSGFLVPSIGFSRNNGLEFEQSYYWRISQNRDLTGAITAFSDAAPLGQVKLRSLEKKGAFEVSVYGTYSNRIDTSGAVIPTGNNVFRGYVEGSGRFQLDPNWSISASGRRASDRTFLRRYDISRDDRLRSTFAAERIDSDSYFSLAGWAVQTLRTGDNQGLSPIALPEIDYRRRINDSLFGGKINIQANSLAIGRTEGQDTQRAFGSVKWDLRKLTGLGQEIAFTALARGDVYHSDENASTATIIYRGQSGWQGRAIVAGATDIKWPFVGKAFGGTQIFTPRVQLVAAPSVKNLKIPNEDSRAVELEDSNLFALNRFPGYDRFEDDYRVTYGFDWALRKTNFTADINIGQSYRLSNRASIFPDGTGLSDKVSDIVGRSEFRFKDIVKLTHRFRLDKDNLAIRRNEVDATIGSRGTYVQAGYLKLNRNIGPTVEDLSDREEIRLAGRVRVARYWSVFGSTIIDLTDTTEDTTTLADGFDPIRHRLGVAYDDDCLSLSLTWRRDYQPTGDARRGNSFLFRLAFRNLGV
ncbi:MAG: LPS-assembly protein LptD [Sphingorhabdus sp.]|uniref:LPS-assembly protein LptD n=1 Tax=Sphingorhabdus sp. TaxID=1902408 RepID=UPI0038FD2E87